MIDQIRGSEARTLKISSMFIAYLLLATCFVTTLAIQPAEAALYGPLKNVSNNSSISISGAIAAYGSNVFVAWSDNSTSVFNNIFVSKSTNGGSSFGTPTQVSNTPYGAFNPTIFAVGSYVYISWSQRTIEDNSQIMFARSSDNGLTYSNPKVVSEVSSSPNDGFPSIVAAGSSVYLSWVNSTLFFGANPFHNSSIFFTKSQDYGINFSNPLSLTGPASNEVSAFAPQVAVSGKSVYVTWQGIDADGLGVKLAVSTNGGSSFGAYKHLVTSNLASSPSSLAISATGKSVYIAYLNNTSSSGGLCTSSSDDDRFGLVLLTAQNCNSLFTSSTSASAGNEYVVAMIKSTDSGKSFGQSKGLQTFTLGTSGSVRLTLSTNNAGKNIFVAYTDTYRAANGERVFDVFITTSKNSGLTFSTPLNLSNDGASINPGIAAYGSNVFIVWQTTAANPANPDVMFTRNT